MEPPPLRAPATWAAVMPTALLGGAALWVWSQGWEVRLKHPWALLSLPLALVAFFVARPVYRPLGASPGQSTARLYVSQGNALAALPRTMASRLVDLPADGSHRLPARGR